MDHSLYGDLAQLDYFIPKSSALCNTAKPSARGDDDRFVVGIYQDEESVDFSALVEACSRNPSTSSPQLATTAASSGSASFLDQEPAFAFDHLLPGSTPLSMYGTDPVPVDSCLDFSPPTSISLPHMSHPVTIEITPTAPTEVERPKSGSKRKAPEKHSVEYREKRNRNNIAVRKSRNKSKQRISETENRVKELEDENGVLQNKIALLTKELNVLKSLFSSAGVPQPSSPSKGEPGSNKD